MGISIVTEKVQESKVFEVVTYEDSFALWLEMTDKSERTVKLYLTGLCDFRVWFEQLRGKALDPALITPLDVRAYRRYLAEERRVKPATVNSYLAAVRAFCRWAMGAGLLAGDPSSGIKGIAIVPPAPRWLTRIEQYRVLNAAQERVQLAALKFGDDASAPGVIRARRDRAIVVLMLNTGLRLSEVANLRMEDVVIHPRSGTVTTIGKGRKWREVKLNKDARAALADWLAVRPGGSGEEQGDEPLFTSQKGGGGMTARAIARRVERIGMLAGVKLTPHMLRHSLAKNMVDDGISMDKIGKALGHSSLDTTQRYTTPSGDDMQATMERVAWRD